MSLGFLFMDLCSKRTIKKILKEHGLSPSKRLGQNFLIDKTILKKILQGADLQANEVVLEIGGGIGTLTQALAKKVKKVIVVEKDPRLVSLLKETLKNFHNIEIIEGDILKILNSKSESLKSKLKSKGYKVVANLPFYLTAPLIRKLLESSYRPKEIVLIVQKEIAQRITAKPPHMNLLALSCQFYGRAKIIGYVSKKSFWPQPEVSGAIITLKPKGLKPKVEKEVFFKIVKAGFCHPRKKLVNNLTKNLGVEKEIILKILKNAKINKDLRPENLSIKNWITLGKIYYSWRKYL